MFEQEQNPSPLNLIPSSWVNVINESKRKNGIIDWGSWLNFGKFESQEIMGSIVEKSVLSNSWETITIEDVESKKAWLTRTLIEPGYISIDWENGKTQITKEGIKEIRRQAKDQHIGYEQKDNKLRINDDSDIIDEVYDELTAPLSKVQPYFDAISDSFETGTQLYNNEKIFAGIVTRLNPKYQVSNETKEVVIIEILPSLKKLFWNSKLGKEKNDKLLRDIIELITFNPDNLKSNDNYDSPLPA